MTRRARCMVPIREEEALVSADADGLFPICPDCYEKPVGLGRPVFPLCDEVWVELLRGQVATLVRIEDRAGGRVWEVQGRVDGLGTPRARLEVWVRGVQKRGSGKAGGGGPGRST